MKFVYARHQREKNIRIINVKIFTEEPKKKKKRRYDGGKINDAEMAGQNRLHFIFFFRFLLQANRGNILVVRTNGGLICLQGLSITIQ